MNTFKGKLFWVGPKEAKGKDPKKPFYIRDFVVEGEKLQKAVFQLKQEGTDIISERNVGQEVEVEWNFDAREYQGRWFGNAVAKDVLFVTKGQSAPSNAVPDSIRTSADDPSDMLPF